MKNILVPTDFSPESHHAFEAAVLLAKRTAGRVVLLHAVALPKTADFSTYGGPVNGQEPSGFDDLFALKLLQTTKKRLLKLVAEAAHLAPGVPVTELIRAAEVGDAIQQVVAEQAIDLVVMGAQGHTAAEHFFFGSNTEKLVRTAPCPVLAVKHPVQQFDIKNLIFPSDFSAEADEAVAQLMRVRAMFPDATLHLLKVVSSPDKAPTALQHIASFAQRNEIGAYTPAVQVAASATAGISAFAEQTPLDLVLLPTHGRTGFSRLFQSSVAEFVATHAFPPVLTYQLS